MSIQFLDRTIQSIDDAVLAKERRTRANAKRIEEERDVAWRCAFLARDIAARAPGRKSLRVGGFSG